MLKPNFFIVGAPRCGTTAMYTYLSEHPNIAMPLYDKEPHYFGTDLISPRFERFRGNEQKYLSLFKHAQNCKRIGEASVLYLRSEKAAHEIYTYNPKSKIIIMIRNPVDMLYSYYLMLSSIQHEDLPTFDQALDAEEARKLGKCLPQNLYVPVETLLYREMADFAPQIRRYQDHFDSEQIKIIVYDDFSDDTARVFKETLDFLEVESDFTVDFRRINSTNTQVMPILKTLFRQPWLVKIGDRMYPVAMPIYKALINLNQRSVPRPQLDSELRSRLLNELRPQIDKLSVLLNRDLSPWYTS